MSYKQLMKKYIWLLFCSIITMLVSGYVYINHYFSFIMLIGVTCSIGSTIELISLIITTHKGNKEEQQKRSVMACVTLELKSQEKKEIEYEQQKKSLMEDIHFNIIFKRIYIRWWLCDREFDEEEIRR